MPGMIDKASKLSAKKPQKPAAPVVDEAPEAAEAPQTPAVPDAPDQETFAQVQGSEEPATPEEQQSYEEAMAMLYKMLYVDDKTSATIVEMIQPNAKVDSIVKASTLIIQQLDERLDLESAVIPELVMEVPDRLIELGERAKQIQFNDGELKAILGSTMEMVMQVVDVDAGEARRLMDNISPEQKAQAERDYNKFLGEAKGDELNEQPAPQEPQPAPGGPGGPPAPGTDEAALAAEQDTGMDEEVPA